MKALRIFIPLETILLILTMGGPIFVPEKVVPLAVWPLLVGLSNLGYTAIRSWIFKTLADNDLAPMLSGVAFTTLGGVLLIDRRLYGPGLTAGLGVAMIAGVIWAMWKARRSA